MTKERKCDPESAHNMGLLLQTIPSTLLISDDILFHLKGELNHQIQILLSQSYPVVYSSFYEVCFVGR